MEPLSAAGRPGACTLLQREPACRAAESKAGLPEDDQLNDTEPLALMLAR